MKVDIQVGKRPRTSISQLKHSIEKILVLESGPQRRANLGVVLEAVRPYLGNDPQAMNDLCRVKALGTATFGSDFALKEIVERIERLVRRIPGLAIEITA